MRLRKRSIVSLLNLNLNLIIVFLNVYHKNKRVTTDFTDYTDKIKKKAVQSVASVFTFIDLRSDVLSTKKGTDIGKNKTDNKDIGSSEKEIY